MTTHSLPGLILGWQVPLRGEQAPLLERLATALRSFFAPGPRTGAPANTLFGRRELALDELDDRMLADIGVTRRDLLALRSGW